jgi:hypothetical protein
MKWVPQVTHKKRNIYKCLVVGTEGKNHLEDLSVNRRIFLKWNLNIENGRDCLE